MSRPVGRPAVVEAVLGVVAEHGLERATVRQVAAEAGVAIGTVQHWFPTKEALLLGAFEEVVARVRQRVAALPLESDGRANLRLVLAELLPLDTGRRRESRVLLSFAARAAVDPALARVQRAVLDDVRAALAEGFALALGAPADSEACAVRAASLLAALDGLALHAVSSRRRGGDEALLAAAETVLETLLLAPR